MQQGWRCKTSTLGWPMTKFLTITDVAELLRLSERTTYAMLREGGIPGAAKVGGKWRVDQAKLLAWMEAGGELQGKPEGGNGSE